MNGCLSVAHSNRFISSTIGGPCYTGQGIDKEQLARNLDMATDVYIKKVNGSPCAKQPIQLFKGANDKHAEYLRERRPKLLTFLKGKKQEKQNLKIQEPTLFKYFEEIWDVRNRHQVPNLPSHYVFMLLLCNQPTCPHPKCKTTVGSLENNILQWYQGGPELSYFPLPVADPLRPWGGHCEDCAPMPCAGHYLKPEEHFSRYKSHGATGMKFEPPSTVIATKYRKAVKNQHQLSSEEIRALAKEVLLTEDEVRMWINHREDVTARRKEGVKKAVQTRAKNKASKKDQTIPSPEEDTENGKYALFFNCFSSTNVYILLHVKCMIMNFFFY